MAGMLQVLDHHCLLIEVSNNNVIQGRRTFQDSLDQLVQVTGGRFQYEFPPDNRDSWKDMFGQPHPAPVPRANIGQVPHDLQLDLTSGSGSVVLVQSERRDLTEDALLSLYIKVWCTKYRNMVEATFARIWAHR